MKAVFFSNTVSTKQTTVVICQIVLALVGECALGGFLPDASLASRVVRGLTLFFVLLVWQRVALVALPGYRIKEKRTFFWQHVILVGCFLLVAICKVLSLGLVSYAKNHSLLSGLSESALAFALPYTTATLIVQSIFGVQAAVVVAVVTAIIAATYSSTSVVVFGVTFVTCIVGLLSLTRVRSRSSYLRAGLNIAIAALPFALASTVLESVGTPLDGAARLIGCVVAAGIGAFVAVGITPVVEHLSGYASEMRLIEMATLDHPLLKELSIQAPGTWNHSMVMGMMVESAANAINANPTVCRVGAYFHDVGKTKKPLYFVENQSSGENRHDKLSPSMSALIIRAHVKDGIELARKHKLPEVIVQMIPQHHGTSLIEYFYDKAKKEAGDTPEDGEGVDPSLYSYPGPKPQTKEAGLLMLADGIEAAARTVSDVTTDRIQGMVQKMINKVFASGQLDECELTLRDLHQIAKSFTRVLTGIYHQRIAYADPVEKSSERNQESDGGHSDGGAAQSDSAKKPRTDEDLKRLGLE